jgi:hypothetical protein
MHARATLRKKCGDCNQHSFVLLSWIRDYLLGSKIPRVLLLLRVCALKAICSPSSMVSHRHTTEAGCVTCAPLICPRRLPTCYIVRMTSVSLRLTAFDSCETTNQVRNADSTFALSVNLGRRLPLPGLRSAPLLPIICTLI